MFLQYFPALTSDIIFFFIELEDEANQPNVRPRSMPDQDVKYCIYMMEKYGEDYEVS